MIFIRKQDEDTPLPVVILVPLGIATLALAAAIWLAIDAGGNLMSPITDGRKAGLPIAVLVIPFGALGIAIIGFFVWMAIQIIRPADGESARRRRDKRLR